MTTGRRSRGVPVAVVGVGYLGRHHARIMSELEEADLVAVSDILPARASDVAGPLGVPSFADYRDLDGRVRAVCVAVPTERHFEVARFFIGRGLHVLVEKPITSRLEQAEELVHLADKNGVILMVGHTERFNPAFMVARKHLQSPMFIESHRIGAFPGRSTNIDVILDVMVHDIDLAMSADPSGIKTVEAVGVEVLTAAIDIANARITMHSGCVANLTASRVSQERLRRIRFFGQNQYLSVDCDLQKVRQVTLSAPRTGEIPAIVSRFLDVEKEEPLRIELRSFLNNIRTGTAPEVDGRAGMASLRAALTVRDCIERHRPARSP